MAVMLDIKPTSLPIVIYLIRYLIYLLQINWCYLISVSLILCGNRSAFLKFLFVLLEIFLLGGYRCFEFCSFSSANTSVKYIFEDA